VTLVEFLNTRYDETEARAGDVHRAPLGALPCITVESGGFEPCNCGVPDQIRRRVTAARGIIRWATQAQMTAYEDGYNLDAMHPLRCLAVEFTDHPDHSPEWNPA
jgi:hypothetical protein